MPTTRKCTIKYKIDIEHIQNESKHDYNILVHYLTEYAIGKPREKRIRQTSWATEYSELWRVTWYIEIEVDCITTIFERVDFSLPPENLLSSVLSFFLPSFHPHPITLSTSYYMCNQSGTASEPFYIKQLLFLDNIV